MSYRFILYFLIAISIFGESQKCCAQLKYHGKEFWLTLGGDHFMGTHTGTPWIPPNPGAGSVAVLILVSKFQASVTFHYTHTNQTANYQLVPNQPLKVKLTITQLKSISGDSLEVVENKSMRISSDSNIAVHLVDATGKGDDGMVIFPSDGQLPPDEYFLLGYQHYNVSPNTAWTHSIVAACDSVVLEITPKYNTWSHFANVPFTVTLTKGQTYQLCNEWVWSTIPSHEISGTRIKVSYASCCPQR